MQKEIWKSIRNYEGLYEVSNLGRVKALAREYICHNGAKRFHADLIMKSHPNGNGYLSLTLHRGGKGKTCRVHKLVIEAFKGFSNLEVNHKNGIKTDNTLKNLEYCTKGENIRHAYQTGLRVFEKEQCGEKNHAAILKTEDVILIRRLWREEKVKQKLLAVRFGVSPVTVNDIIKRRRWAHVS